MSKSPQLDAETETVLKQVAFCYSWLFLI